MKPRKVRQEHQPRGESSTPSGYGQKLLSGQELKRAEEGLCTTEDSQSATGFGGEVAFPGKVMADSETQKLERKDFFQRIVEKVDGGGGGSKRSFRRDIVRV